MEVGGENTTVCPNVSRNDFHNAPNLKKYNARGIPILYGGVFTLVEIPFKISVFIPIFDTPFNTLHKFQSEKNILLIEMNLRG